jgi:hypothetical protein
MQLKSRHLPLKLNHPKVLEDGLNALALIFEVEEVTRISSSLISSIDEK